MRGVMRGVMRGARFPRGGGSIFDLFDFDLRNGLPSVFTYTRTGEDRAFDADGVLQTFSANTPAIYRPLDTLENLGLQFYEASAKNALHVRDLTNAVWSGGLNMTAAKDATGLDNVANSASSLTASAANGTIFQPITLISLERTMSCYVRRKTGVGTVEISDDGGTTFQGITLTGSYQLFSKTRTQANPSIGFRIVTNADAIEVDFVDIEDKNYVSSPVNSGASVATRGDPLCFSLIGAIIPSWSSGDGATIYCEAFPAAVNPPTQSRSILSINPNHTGGTNPRYRIDIRNASAEISMEHTGLGGGAPAVFLENFTPTIAADTLFKAIFVAFEADFEGTFDGGTTLTASTIGALPTGFTDVVIGADFNGEVFPGHAVKRIAMSSRRLTNAQLIEVTT